MNLTFLRRCFVAALVSLTAFAADTGTPPTKEDTLAGLQTVLTTSGYKFYIEDIEAAGDAVSHASFTACATVYNRSSTHIPFTFPNPAVAERKFTFRVFGSDGNLVWESDAGLIAAQVITTATLEKRTKWKRLLQIPLKFEGKALTPGIYTLEASIDADKQLGASAIFEVAKRPAPPEPGKETGIKGLALKATGNPPGAANILPEEVPAAGASVNITELRGDHSTIARALFVWNGKVGDDGKFSVNTPAARFRVTATLPAVQTDSGFVPAVSKSIEVTVVDGKFAEVTIHLPVPPPPSLNSGIKGLVLYGPITPVAVEGHPNEAPAVGASVVIEQIVPAGTVNIAAPFRWTGVTGGEGRFDAHTPTGRFRVVTTLAPPVTTNTAAIAAPSRSASAEVTVEAGHVTEVTLHIDTGIR